MSGEVRKVTTVALMPVVLSNNRAARFCVLPGTMVPILSLPGLACAALIRSPTVCSGDPARVTIKRSKKEAVETEAKSVKTLNGSDLNKAVAIAVLLPVINSV